MNVFSCLQKMANALTCLPCAPPVARGYKHGLAALAPTFATSSCSPAYRACSFLGCFSTALDEKLLVAMYVHEGGMCGQVEV